MTIQEPLGPPALDFIILGGKVSPGKATIKGLGEPRKWDERDGYGFSGASLVYGGDKLAHFSVMIELWLDSHHDDWDDFAKVLEKPPLGQLAKALKLLHPAANRSPHKIQDVVIEDVLGPDEDETGLWTYEIKLIQFRPPKKIIAKPVAATPDVGQTGDALSAAEIQQEILRAQFGVKQQILNGGKP